ncbi:MAG: hypothetical protein VCC00_01095 [Deltaproteobacteria bacterium]
MDDTRRGRPLRKGDGDFLDELGGRLTLQNVGNSRRTISMHGSGLIEMLARQLTDDLQAIRDAIAPGGQAALVAKGISFGTLARLADGSWDTAAVDGLPAPALRSYSSSDPPDLILRPFHQAARSRDSRPSRPAGI